MYDIFKFKYICLKNCLHCECFTFSIRRGHRVFIIAFNQNEYKSLIFVTAEKCFSKLRHGNFKVENAP